MPVSLFLCRLDPCHPLNKNRGQDEKNIKDNLTANIIPVDVVDELYRLHHGVGIEISKEFP